MSNLRTFVIENEVSAFYRMFVLSLVEVLCGQHGVPHDAGFPHAAGVPHAARTVQDHRQKCQLARKYLTPAATSTDVER